MMDVRFVKSFEKQLKKRPVKQQEQFFRRLQLFLHNPYADQLNNHTLKGSWKGRRSINITGDLRALYKQERNIATFVAIGTHSELYK